MRPGISTGAFTALSPATTITPTPHAQVAGNALIATTVVDGAIGSAQIADDSITSADIANSSVTNLDLAANSVSSNVIADDSITAQDIAPNAVTSSELGTNAVITAKINDGAVTTSKIADNAITSAKIASGAITDGDIASRTITGQSIALGSIDDTNLANNAVTSAKIADGTITDFDIAINTISGQSIANGAISGAKLATDAVSSSKILDGTVTAADAAFNNFWLAKGNVNTNPTINFLGTTDGKPLQIKANGLGINVADPEAGLDVRTDKYVLGSFRSTVSPFEMDIRQNGEIDFYGANYGARLAYDEYTSPDGPQSRITLGTGNAALRLHFNRSVDKNWAILDFSDATSNLAYKPGGGPWDSYSDIRLKHDVRPLTGALEHLLQLRSVTFVYNEGAGKGFPKGMQTGFVAQEVQQVFPEWVNEGPDGYLMVGSKGFESLTVQALRELRAEKDDEIAALKDENAALHARIDAIEARLGGH